MRRRRADGDPAAIRPARSTGTRRTACGSTMRSRAAAAVSPYYDSMIAKLVAHAATRAGACAALAAALDHTVCLGVTTNRSLLARCCATRKLSAGRRRDRFSGAAFCRPPCRRCHRRRVHIWRSPRCGLPRIDAADLPPAWACSALAAPRETVLPLAIGDDVQRLARCAANAIVGRPADRPGTSSWTGSRGRETSWASQALGSRAWRRLRSHAARRGSAARRDRRRHAAYAAATASTCSCGTCA